MLTTHQVAGSATFVGGPGVLDTLFITRQAVAVKIHRVTDISVLDGYGTYVFFITISQCCTVEYLTNSRFSDTKVTSSLIWMTDVSQGRLLRKEKTSTGDVST